MSFIATKEFVPIIKEKDFKNRVFNEIESKQEIVSRGIVGINISGVFTLLGHFRVGYMIPYNIVEENIENWNNQK